MKYNTKLLTLNYLAELEEHGRFCEIVTYILYSNGINITESSRLYMSSVTRGCLKNLIKSGMVEQPSRGKYQLTAKGRQSYKV